MFPDTDRYARANKTACSADSFRNPTLELCLTLQQDRCLRVQPTPTGPPATDLVKGPRAGRVVATAAGLRSIRADRAPPVLLCASPAGCAVSRVRRAPTRRREFRCVAVITSPLTPGPGYDSEVGEGCLVGQSREGHGKVGPADTKVLARLCGHSPHQTEELLDRLVTLADCLALLPDTAHAAWHLSPQARGGSAATSQPLRHTPDSADCSPWRGE